MSGPRLSGTLLSGGCIQLVGDEGDTTETSKAANANGKSAFGESFAEGSKLRVHEETSEVQLGKGRGPFGPLPWEGLR